MQGARGRWKASQLLFPNSIIFPLIVSGTPVNGPTGTGAGKAGPGSFCLSTGTGAVYTNTNTKASPTWSQIAPGQGQSATTQTALSAAQLTTLHSVPIVGIIADPGAGNVAIFESLVFEFIFGTTPFTGGGNVQLQYHGQTANVMSSTIAAASLTGSASFVAQFTAAATASGIVVPTTNASLDLIAAGSDFAAGDSTAKVFARSRILTL